MTFERRELSASERKRGVGCKRVLNKYQRPIIRGQVHGSENSYVLGTRTSIRYEAEFRRDAISL